MPDSTTLDVVDGCGCASRSAVRLMSTVSRRCSPPRGTAPDRLRRAGSSGRAGVDEAVDLRLPPHEAVPPAALGPPAKATQPSAGTPTWLTQRSREPPETSDRRGRRGDPLRRVVGATDVERVRSQPHLHVASAGEAQEDDEGDDGERIPPTANDGGISRRLETRPTGMALPTRPEIATRRTTYLVSPPCTAATESWWPSPAWTATIGASRSSHGPWDAGFEVIYTGLFQTPEQVAETGVQEDADAVGLSVLSGAHMTLFPRVIEELTNRDLDDVLGVRWRHRPGPGHRRPGGHGRGRDSSPPARPWKPSRRGSKRPSTSVRRRTADPTAPDVPDTGGRLPDPPRTIS